MSWEGIRTSVVARRRAPVLLAVALVALVVAGCGGSGGTTSESTSAESTTAGTTPASGEATAAGKAIFQQQCSSCHKLAAAKATFGTYGPDLDQLKPSQATVEQQVTTGGGIMPAYGKDGLLSSAEIESVASYVAAEAGK
jgi:cytochrome c6